MEALYRLEFELNGELKARFTVANSPEKALESLKKDYPNCVLSG